MNKSETLANKLIEIAKGEKTEADLKTERRLVEDSFDFTILRQKISQDH
jgi:hypothetical protein